MKLIKYKIFWLLYVTDYSEDANPQEYTRRIGRSPNTPFKVEIHSFHIDPHWFLGKGIHTIRYFYFSFDELYPVWKTFCSVCNKLEEIQVIFQQLIHTAGSTHIGIRGKLNTITGNRRQHIQHRFVVGIRRCHGNALRAPTFELGRVPTGRIASEHSELPPLTAYCGDWA